MRRQNVYVTGLPRSGSTLLTQLLGEHPDIYSDTHSSPLASQVERMRRGMSNDPFYRSRLDVNFDTAYRQLQSSIRGMMDGWLSVANENCVVDKSRQWLPMVETLNELDPDCKILICIRELSDIFASIERQHKRTLLINFPDSTDHNSAESRALALFSPEGVIGSSIEAIKRLQDIIPPLGEGKVYFVAYEALVKSPAKIMSDIFEFIGLDQFEIDPENLTIRKEESDSYYNMKYPHKLRRSVSVPPPNRPVIVSRRISEQIRSEFKWYYEAFYPAILLNG